jgi:hypothetical protein
MTNTRALLLSTLVLAGLAVATTAGSAAAAAGSATDISSNWSGYAVTSPSTTYTSVTGTWRQPTAACSNSSPGSSAAFWVGLGGYSSTSQALEQVGTSADCGANGQPTYYAWYELVPNASVTIKLAIKPGDLITTSVNALDATTIELQVKDRTRKTSFTTKKTFANPDLSSAEWIAEAPSQCAGNRCTEVPLTDFGSVSFSNVAAIGNGNGGTLAEPAWTATPIQLESGGGSGFFPGPQRFSGGSSGAGATPGAIAADGRSFGVTWHGALT